MKPKVLMTRRLPESAIERLRKYVKLDINPEDMIMTKTDISEEIEDKDGLICQLTDNIDNEIIDHAPRLKIIADYAVGFNNIDVAAATRRRIPVTNTPGVLTDTTADLTFALILSVSRRIIEADKYVHEGNFRGWEPMLMLGHDLYKKTLGIIGLGRIGQAVAKRAHGFDMKVIYYKPERMSAKIEKAYGVRYAALNDLLKEADIISIHVSLTDQTYHMIGAAELRLIKKSAYLINVARGPVIDEKALVNALNNKSIAGCGLDVYEREPAIEAGLLQLTNVVLLPHIGSASIETRTEMAMMVAENVIAVLDRGERPPNIVNPEIYT